MGVTTEMADSSSEDEDNTGRNEIDEDVADIKKIMLRLVVNPNKMKKIFVRLDTENTKSLSQGEFHFFVGAACKHAKKPINEVIFKKYGIQFNMIESETMMKLLKLL